MDINVYCERLANYVIAKASHDISKSVDIHRLEEIAMDVILPSGETVRDYTAKITKNIACSLIYESYLSQVCDRAYANINRDNLNGIHKEVVLFCLEVPTDKKELANIHAEARVAVSEASRALYGEDYY
jgi:hypothetical protein